MTRLIYTFRTFPHIKKLQEIYGDIFVFGKMNESFEFFKVEIDNYKPDQILGIAKSNNITRVESIAINNIHNNKINKNGHVSYNLFVPTTLEYIKSTQPTNSFCNWTMYKISEYIENNNLDTKLTFIHMSPSPDEIKIVTKDFLYN